jgi:LysM repeat protein
MLANNELVQKSLVLNTNDKYYVAMDTESIYEIAEKYNVSSAGIRNWNNIPIDQDSIEEGRTIVISGFEAEKNRIKKLENNNNDDDNNVTSIFSLPEIITYKVVEGDNLSTIAKKYNTTEKVIKELNPNIKNDKILIGELLIIPNNNKQTTTANNTNKNNNSTTNNTNKNTTNKNDNDVKIHTVTQGENLYRIAIKYSTTVDKILSLNRGLNPDRISIGQKIRIK